MKLGIVLRTLVSQDKPFNGANPTPSAEENWHHSDCLLGRPAVDFRRLRGWRKRCKPREEVFYEVSAQRLPWALWRQPQSKDWTLPSAHEKTRLLLKIKSCFGWPRPLRVTRISSLTRSCTKTCWRT